MAFKLRSSIQSLIPLLYARFGSAQAAVDHATEILVENVLGFENAAGQLLASPSGIDINLESQLHNFVQGCRFYCSGNLVWRCGSPLPREDITISQSDYPCLSADSVPFQSDDAAVRHRLQGHKPRT